MWAGSARVVTRLALGAAAGHAAAQPAPPPVPNPGPDVLVGDLPDTLSYGTDGSGVYAYDIGTHACNVGNVNLRWQAGTPLHPVIAQNVYRLKDGRFEQLGQSWVKHGFFALGQNLCGTCNGQSTGSVLGVGCSDPYDAGLNGTQTGLGPRSLVNPVTGAFPYNPSAWPPVTTPRLSRRLQIRGEDVDPAQNPGALYFAEAIYITPDDASAGNGRNNASYRPVLFSAGQFLPSSFNAATPTVRGRPALYAWRDADPAVAIGGVDVPGDGRFLVAARATDLGTGGWRYQYAVFNLDSDRAAGGFTVPLPPGKTASDATFRLVPSHSGEPYSNAPWSAGLAAGRVAFATPQTFAQDPASSALRWGTMYTFGFTADAAPAPGSVSIALFKPGAAPWAGVTGALVGVPTPGGALAAAPPPPGDDCGGAPPLSAGENLVSLFGATPGGPSPVCGGPGPDAWFTYTYAAYAPACPGALTFTACAADGTPVVVSVFSGPGCPAEPGAELACATGGAACPGGARAAVAASIGRSYLVRLRLPPGSPGASVTLTVEAPFCVPPNGACCQSTGQCAIVAGAASCFTGTFVPGAASCSPNPCALPPPPGNDVCSAAAPIGDALAGAPSVLANNVLAGTEIFDACPLSQFGQKDVWYVYTPARSGTFEVDLCQLPPSGVPLDTVLSVRAGSCAAEPVACADDDPDGCASLSRLTVAGVAGTPYYLRVAGYAGQIGDFVVRVRGGGGLPLTVAGACCRGSTCAPSVPAGCAGPGSRFAGVGAACNPPGVRTAPCCLADFDQSARRDLPDIFAFLEAWFAADPRADIDAGGSVDLPDIFVFLEAWFAGGC